LDGCGAAGVVVAVDAEVGSSADEDEAAPDEGVMMAEAYIFASALIFVVGAV
jgi:hypothetical protein